MKTHCPRGHEFTAENTYFDRNDQKTKKCRQCRRERKHRADARRIAAGICIRGACRNPVSSSNRAYCDGCRAKMQKASDFSRYHRKSRYGAEQSWYQAALMRQNSRCAICRAKRRLVVDHDHATGKPRELLCDYCNTGIGYLESGLATAARRYLKKHNPSNANQNHAKPSLFLGEVPGDSRKSIM